MRSIRLRRPVSVFADTNDIASTLSASEQNLHGSDEALTAHGGLVAWDNFLKRCEVIAELAACDPLPRTSPNATPVVIILFPTADQRLKSWAAATLSSPSLARSGAAPRA